MSDNVIIVGAAGSGREAADVLEAMQVPILGVLDDGPSQVNLDRLEQRGLAYLGTVDDWLASHERPEASYLIGISNGRVKEMIAGKFDRAGYTAFSAIHPTVTIGANTVIGPGALICAGVRITTNITIGRHVHLNLNVAVGHDSVLHDFVSINPTANVSGEVRIGERTLLGVGSTILQGLTIGADTTIGACALATKSVPDGVVVMGVPGRW